MAKVKLTRAEQETVIGWDNTPGCVASIMSHDKQLNSKLMSLVESGNTSIKLIRIDEDEDNYFFEVPRRWVKVSPPRQVTLTDDERAAKAERMKVVRASKQVR